MKSISFLLVLISLSAFSQSTVRSTYVDSLVELSMKKFPQAAVSVAVIQNGKIVHSKGYGVLNSQTKTKADDHSLFAIASNSKAFTSTALGILVDQGKLKWTDKVVKYIPEFKMYDSYVTENFTILDLLTHRSGLGLGAGDLMFFPDGGDFTIDDVVKSFQYQDVVSDFRTKYDYDNLLYIVAGEVIFRISGKKWDKFVEDEIMSKLNMSESKGLYENISDQKNVTSPHKTEKNELVPLKAMVNKDGLLGAAGGIYSNVTDLSKWVLMHLNEGKYGDDLSKQLISKENHQELWKMQTLITYDALGTNNYKTHYRGYGLGFGLQDQNGYTIVSHTGGLPGMLSMITMIPELKAGIIVLTNTEPGGLSFYSISNQIKDVIIGVEGTDWIKIAEDNLSKNSSYADSVVNAVWKQVEKSKKTAIDKKQFLGEYSDDWFGGATITEKNGELIFTCVRSPKLTGKMYYYQANTFAIKWEYQDMECDAFALFELDENGKAIGIKMKGISPAIDFSFDFQDLNFKRIK